jgi:hypothetical protein
MEFTKLILSLVVGFTQNQAVYGWNLPNSKADTEIELSVS